MITQINYFAEKMIARKGITGRFFSLFREYCWIFKQILVEHEIVHEEDIVIPPVNENLLWRKATLDDLKNMALSGKYQIDRKNLPYYYALISDGNLMFLGEENGRILTHCAVVFGKKIFADQYFPLLENEGFILAVFTPEEYRGRSLASQALVQLFRTVYREKQCTRLFAHIDSWNTASIRAFQKAGWTLAKTSMYRIRLLQSDFVFQTGKDKNRFVYQKNIRQPEKEIV